MIEFTKGDILRADVEALVNTVNCVGVMGRGIALQFKNAFPDNYRLYASACAKDLLRPGYMFVHELHALTNPRYIINFPTKRHWRGSSRLEDIELGLNDLVDVIRDRGIKSVAVPPLGSGLGGLPWGEVRPRIIEALSRLDDVKVVVYEPHTEYTPTVRAKAKSPPKMTTGRASLVVLMNQYLRGLLDPFVTLLELHKLMYFMQEAGQQLRLRYVKATYGPFAENLSHVLKAVEGYYIEGYQDGGDQPAKRLELIPGAFADAKRRMEDDATASARFARVATLVEGFETPFGLELLSSVHWLAVYENVRTIDSITDRMYQWSDRKRRFTKDQIALAYQVLTDQEWIPESKQ